MKEQIADILEQFQDIGPEVFEQTVKWGIVANGAGAILCVLVIVVAMCICRSIYKSEIGNDDKVMGYALFGLLFGLLPAAGLIFSIHNWLQAIIAPYAYFMGTFSN